PETASKRASTKEGTAPDSTRGKAAKKETITQPKVTMATASLAFRRGDLTCTLDKSRPVRPKIPMESRIPITAPRSLKYRLMPKGMVKAPPSISRMFPRTLATKPKFMPQPPSLGIKQLVQFRQLSVQAESNHPVLGLNDKVALGNEHLPAPNNGAQD